VSKVQTSVGIFAKIEIHGLHVDKLIFTRSPERRSIATEKYP